MSTLAGALCPTGAGHATAAPIFRFALDDPSVPGNVTDFTIEVFDEPAPTPAALSFAGPFGRFVETDFTPVTDPLSFAIDPGSDPATSEDLLLARRDAQPIALDGPATALASIAVASQSIPSPGAPDGYALPPSARIGLAVSSPSRGSRRPRSGQPLPGARAQARSSASQSNSTPVPGASGATASPSSITSGRRV